ncbi:MAG: hypothetical protein ACOC9B_03430 [Chloroflexota bacterium]
MRYLRIAALLCMALALGVNGCGPAPESVTVTYDFRDGAQGWEAGFAEYGEGMDMQLESGLRQLPPGLESEGTGFYLQGMNRSDDLFMFLKKRLTAADGIVPEQDYRVSFDIVFASNAPSGAVGIGGPPGEAVYLKAGATPVEPERYLDDSDHWMLNVDKGGGNSGEGEAATVVDTIENGLPAEEVDLQNPPYVSLTRSHQHDYTVTASDDGELWLLVGTDSGFEGLTGIYYQEINVALDVA